MDYLFDGIVGVFFCRTANIFSTNDTCEDPTQLLSTLQVTDLCGIVSLMYGVLLHSGMPPRRDVTPPEMSAQTLSILTAGFKMLNQLAAFDLALLQVGLCKELFVIQLL